MQRHQRRSRDIRFNPYKQEWQKGRRAKKATFGKFLIWIVALIVLVALAYYGLSMIS